MNALIGSAIRGDPSSSRTRARTGGAGRVIALGDWTVAHTGTGSLRAENKCPREGGPGGSLFISDGPLVLCRRSEPVRNRGYLSLMQYRNPAGDGGASGRHPDEVDA